MAPSDHGRRRTIYTRTGDLPVWARAEQEASDSLRSLSELVADALRQYLGEPAAALPGVWVAHDRDGSAVWIHRTELEALRFATQSDGLLHVAFVEFGHQVIPPTGRLAAG
jgi:hypothetical protein